MPELRFDILTGDFAIIATERAKRPSDFKASKEAEHLPERDPKCPFCPGNEKLTPPETYALRNGTEPDSPGWTVRVVPNKFPALSPASGASLEELEALRAGMSWPPETGDSSMYWEVPAVGAHEVVVESARHDLSLGDYTREHLASVLEVLKTRMLALYDRQEIKYVQVFRNFGPAGGASLAHPHFQIIALPVVPPRVSLEQARFLKYESTTRRCLLCDLVEREIEKGERVIAKTDEFVVLCPFASRHSFETSIIPRKHSPNFAASSGAELSSLADTMGDLFSRYETMFPSLSYNMVLHSAPLSGRNKGGQPYHWHFHILPRLTIEAGLELGTHVQINPTPPEVAREQFLSV
ncbi:MAG TPA: galactose-1-phosphate uridylyltransferase [Firmicutes bacterium]|nr:galactose-1-phosphate uridylyltransferase [Candidatus Fermentithermobacillaceae bacterium]